MNALTDQEEILYRQIHPAHFENGEPLSLSFRPTADDFGKLSVDRSALTTPSESWSCYKGQGRSSAAVFGVTVGECLSEHLVPCSDPLIPQNPAHAVVDFGRRSNSECKLIAKVLKRRAIARGVLYLAK